MSEIHEHPLPVEGCWRCDLKARLICMRHELDMPTTHAEGTEATTTEETL